MGAHTPRRRASTFRSAVSAAASAAFDPDDAADDPDPDADSRVPLAARFRALVSRYAPVLLGLALLEGYLRLVTLAMRFAGVTVAPLICALVLLTAALLVSPRLERALSALLRPAVDAVDAQIACVFILHHRRPGQRTPARRRVACGDRRLFRRVPPHHVHRGLHRETRRRRRSIVRAFENVVRSAGGDGVRVEDARRAVYFVVYVVVVFLRASIVRARGALDGGGDDVRGARPPRAIFLERARADARRRGTRVRVRDVRGVFAVSSRSPSMATRGRVSDHHRGRRDGAHLRRDGCPGGSRR